MMATLPMYRRGNYSSGDDFVLEDFNDAAEAYTGGGVREWSGMCASVIFPDYPHILGERICCGREEETKGEDDQLLLPPKGKASHGWAIQVFKRAYWRKI